MSSVCASAVLSPKNALIVLCDSSAVCEAVNVLCDEFCGIVVRDAAQLLSIDDLGVFRNIYIIGDVGEALTACNFAAETPTLHADCCVCAVREFTHNIPDDMRVVPLGLVPRLIPGIGVFYPGAFEAPGDLFRDVLSQHKFCELTESTKASFAYRKGVYITEVTPLSKRRDAAAVLDRGAAANDMEDVEDVSAASASSPTGLEFKLLRCSTNFSSPTENCRPADATIMRTVNELARSNYENAAQLDHALAQVYYNSIVEGKEKKARISSHSDKTKDMPRNALMAFVTLYDIDEASKATLDCRGFDVLYRGRSALTQLVWREKEGSRVIRVTLYPGSVLLVSMDTNRLYTHEIQPSILPVTKIPVRLGYVVRCSSTVAVHADGKTMLRSGRDADSFVDLRRPTAADMLELKAHYARENASIEVIKYTSSTHGVLIPYSMNAGDYLAPRL